MSARSTGKFAPLQVLSPLEDEWEKQPTKVSQQFVVAEVPVPALFKMLRLLATILAVGFCLHFMSQIVIALLLWYR